MRQNEKRLELIEKGLCPQCWKPRDDEGQTCSKCRKRRREQAAARRRAAGKTRASRGRKPITMSTNQFLLAAIMSGKGFVLTRKRAGELVADQGVLTVLASLEESGNRAAGNMLRLGKEGEPKEILKITMNGAKTLAESPELVSALSPK